jgi:hypothetical protein
MFFITASLPCLPTEEQEVCHGLVIIISCTFHMLYESIWQGLSIWEIIAETDEGRSEKIPHLVPRVKQ